MDESVIHDIPQASHEEKAILSTNFMKKEVYETIMQIKKNKAPGPNGFQAVFYQSFWDVIKVDFMRLFEPF
jgi:hypothetical protein